MTFSIRCDCGRPKQWVYMKCPSCVIRSGVTTVFCESCKLYLESSPSAARLYCDCCFNDLTTTDLMDPYISLW